jgi:hypothetical protein
MTKKQTHTRPYNDRPYNDRPYRNKKTKKHTKEAAKMNHYSFAFWLIVVLLAAFMLAPIIEHFFGVGG